MLDQALQGLPGEIEAVIVGVAALEAGDDAQGLGVVVEAAESRHAVVEGVLAGVAEGGVAEVVRERERLGEILVEAEGSREGPGDLPDLDRMGQAGAEMVALVVDEDLGLVVEAAEGGRVDDAVAVALELGAGRRGRLRHKAAAALRRVAGIGRPPSLAEGPHGFTPC